VKPLTETKQEQKSKALVWSVIVLHMLNHVISGSMPIIFPDLMDEFQISYTELGLIRSAARLATGFPQMFVGLFRRWFSGRVIISIGNTINAVMNIGISISQGFAQFLGLSVIAGIGSSVQHPMGASIVSNWSNPNERGKMLGLNQSIPSIAFTFTPLITAYLLTKMGWRSTLGLLSIPALSLSLYTLFFIRGSSDIEAKTRESLNLGKLREQLKNRNIMSISILRSVMAFRMGVRTFLPLYFINVLGFTAKGSSLLYSILLGGGVLGPFFWGWLSDRVNRKPLIIGIMVSSAVGYFMLNFVKGFWGLAALLFFIGFMVQTVIIQSVMTDSVDRTQLDQLFGLYFTIGFTIASFSSAIFGWVVETYGFGVGFSYITGVSLISLIPAFFIQEPRNNPSIAETI
jgi:FSR family fosmidomycin resistance protein-like MFS transporter